MIDGIVLVDKPQGWTSFDVVAKIRGQLKRETGQKKPKVGHTGTLDPLATGLLVIVTGKYTKRAGEFSQKDKTYEAAMALGKASTTGDAEGDISEVSDRVPDESEIAAALQAFAGEISQTPHRYSAIKVDGRRSYELARKGVDVKLEPRKVTIHEIEMTGYDYPEVRFRAKVSSGTYIRSLIEDIGGRLGTGAYMSGLRRTQVGDFDLADAIDVKDFDANSIRQV